MNDDETTTSIVTAIAPQADATRVVAVTGAGRTLLKARLLRSPQHWKAMPTLLEALAFWQGAPVRASLVASGDALPSDSRLFGEAFDDAGTSPLYTLDLVWNDRSRKRKAHRPKAGQFRALHNLLVDAFGR